MSILNKSSFQQRVNFIDLIDLALSWKEGRPSWGQKVIETPYLYNLENIHRWIPKEKGQGRLYSCPQCHRVQGHRVGVRSWCPHRVAGSHRCSHWDGPYRHLRSGRGPRRTRRPQTHSSSLENNVTGCESVSGSFQSSLLHYSIVLLQNYQRCLFL